MLLMLTTRSVYNSVTTLVRQTGGAVPLTMFPTWAAVPRPGAVLYPTVPGALRAALEIHEPALLAVNCAPVELAAMPRSYEVPPSDAAGITAKPLPTAPGKLGVDFAIAFAMAQLAVSSKMEKAGKREHAAYFVEAAGLSAGSVCSVASCEMMEQIHAAFQNDPTAVPWPDGVLWPDGVSDWLAGFGFGRDDEEG